MTFIGNGADGYPGVPYCRPSLCTLTYIEANLLSHVTQSFIIEGRANKKWESDEHVQHLCLFYYSLCISKVTFGMSTCLDVKYKYDCQKQDYVGMWCMFYYIGASSSDLCQKYFHDKKHFCLILLKSREKIPHIGNPIFHHGAVIIP